MVPKRHSASLTNCFPSTPIIPIIPFLEALGITRAPIIPFWGIPYIPKGSYHSLFRIPRDHQGHYCSLFGIPGATRTVFFQSVGPESINITTDISKFLNFVLTLMLAFGFSFQIPILVNALIRLNIFKKHRLKEFRGIFLIICFTFGAIFTPPDVISQILLALPIIALYEVSIIFSKFLTKSK